MARIPDLDVTAIRRFMQQRQAPSSEWLRSGPYRMYLRKAVPRRLPEFTLERPIDLANIERAGNEIQMENLPPEMRPPKGKFKELLAMLESEAYAQNHDSIYVENIMNEFLPDVLARNGYTRDPFSPWQAIPSMYKRLR